MNSYIYCFIREDISPEQKIVQLGHACHEAGKLLPANEFREPSTMILLSAKDEADLKSISRRIDCAGIDHSMFYEPDPMPNGRVIQCQMVRGWATVQSAPGQSSPIVNEHFSVNGICIDTPIDSKHSAL